MTDEPTDQTENMTLHEAREQLAQDKEAHAQATEHLEHLQQRLSDGDRDVTPDDLAQARAKEEHTRLQIRGSEKTLIEVAQRVADEFPKEIQEEALADLKEDQGKVEEARQEVTDARNRYLDAIKERNKQVGKWHRKLREARPENLPEDVDTDAYIRANKAIGRHEVEYKTFPWEEGEDVYVFHDGKRRERAGRVTLAER